MIRDDRPTINCTRCSVGGVAAQGSCACPNVHLCRECLISKRVYSTGSTSCCKDCGKMYDTVVNEDYRASPGSRTRESIQRICEPTEQHPELFFLGLQMALVTLALFIMLVMPRMEDSIDSFSACPHRANYYGMAVVVGLAFALLVGMIANLSGASKVGGNLYVVPLRLTNDEINANWSLKYSMRLGLVCSDKRTIIGYWSEALNFVRVSIIAMVLIICGITCGFVVAMAITSMVVTVMILRWIFCVYRYHQVMTNGITTDPPITQSAQPNVSVRDSDSQSALLISTDNGKSEH